MKNASPKNASPFLKKPAGAKPPTRKEVRRGLGGRGLSALTGAEVSVVPPVAARAVAPAAAAPAAGGGVVYVVPMDVERSPWQARCEFDEAALNELAESIKANGVIQPPVVRKRADGKYELVAGERRMRASIIAGLKKVPVLVVDAGDRKAAEMGVVENIQRRDLNVIEEAEGYKLLKDQFNVTQEDIAERVGKSRPAVANALRLLELPDEVKQMLTRRVLTTGHAKVLLSVDGDHDRTVLARECITEKRNADGSVSVSVISVRDLEKKVERMRRPVAEPRRGVPDLPASYVKSLVDALHRQLGAAVRVTSGVTHANGRHTKGVLEIDFFDNDDLDRVLTAMGVKLD
ncbi:MAG: ParB/RepB/Spo0J family partition protein [Kiritimatiellae bacterium]|nr:ParB/RepB/Spo0J family partition protein [Kiritimatiellia bacterium]